MALLKLDLLLYAIIYLKQENHLETQENLRFIPKQKFLTRKMIKLKTILLVKLEFVDQTYFLTTGKIKRKQKKLLLMVGS